MHNIRKFFLVLVAVSFLPLSLSSQSISDLSAPELLQKYYELSSQYEKLQLSYQLQTKTCERYEQSLKRVLEISTAQMQNLQATQQSSKILQEDLTKLKLELEATQLALKSTADEMQKVLQELVSLKENYEALQKEYQAILMSYENLSTDYQELMIRLQALLTDYEKLSISLKEISLRAEMLQNNLDAASLVIESLEEQIIQLGLEIKKSFWKGIGIGSASGAVVTLVLLALITKPFSR